MYEIYKLTINYNVKETSMNIDYSNVYIIFFILAFRILKTILY